MEQNTVLQCLHFTHLDLRCIIWGNCSSTLEDKLPKEGGTSNLRL